MWGTDLVDITKSRSLIFLINQADQKLQTGQKDLNYLNIWKLQNYQITWNTSSTSTISDQQKLEVPPALSSPYQPITDQPITELSTSDLPIPEPTKAPPTGDSVPGLLTWNIQTDTFSPNHPQTCVPAEEDQCVLEPIGKVIIAVKVFFDWL